MEHQSIIDPTRKTVGAIYRDAQINGERGLITGDMNYELRKSLTEDLNETIVTGTKEFGERIFYITVYERRDLQMKNAFIRRMIKTKYRPYPEADTLVFKVIPDSNEVYFCWHLPARYEMINMLNSTELRQTSMEQEELAQFRRWERSQLEYYGFAKNEEGNWVENYLYSGDKMVSISHEKAVVVSLHASNAGELLPEAS